MSKFNSFKELLLKKAVDNKSLQDIIPLIKEEIIADLVIESLEKMAAAGMKTSGPISDFGKRLMPSDVDNLRHAVSHHLSHYRSALKNNNRDVADQHLEQIIPMLHMIGQAGSHTGGKLAISMPNLRPWEANYTSHFTRKQVRDLGHVADKEHKGSPDALHRETDGLNARPSQKGAKVKFGGMPDYRYLEMPHNSNYKVSPRNSGHISYKDHSSHEGGYPFEEIQIGSPQDIKAGKGWVHIDDSLPAQEKFTPHPYDSHPVFNMVKKLQTDSDIEGQHEKIAKDIAEWNKNNSQQLGDTVLNHYDSNPDSGEKKSNHFFQGLPLLEQPSWAKKNSSSIKPQIEAQQSANVQPQSEAKQIEHDEHIKNLPPHLQAKFAERLKGVK